MTNPTYFLKACKNGDALIFRIPKTVKEGLGIVKDQLCKVTIEITDKIEPSTKGNPNFKSKD